MIIKRSAVLLEIQKSAKMIKNQIPLMFIKITLHFQSGSYKTINLLLIKFSICKTLTSQRIILKILDHNFYR